MADEKTPEAELTSQEIFEAAKNTQNLANKEAQERFKNEQSGAKVEKPFIEKEESADDDGIEMTFFGNDEQPEVIEEDGKEKVVAKKDFSRFKEIDEDVEDDDKLYDKFKSYKEENQKLRTLAGGRTQIDNDPDIKVWNNLLKEKNEDLYIIAHTQSYLESGDYNKETAEAKARQKLEKLRLTDDEGVEAIEEFALNVKRNVRGAINEKVNYLTRNIQEAEKSLDLRSFDKKVIDNAISEVSKTESFIGFKIPENERAKLQKGVSDALTSGKIQKLLKDPKKLADVAFFLEHQEQWTKNVLARKNAKQSIANKVLKQPPLTTQKKVVFAPKKAEGNQNRKGLIPNIGAFMGA